MHHRMIPSFLSAGVQPAKWCDLLVGPDRLATSLGHAAPSLEMALQLSDSKASGVPVMDGVWGIPLLTSTGNCGSSHHYRDLIMCQPR